MGEIDSFLLFIPLKHRKIDDPAELEAILGNKSELFANLRPRRAGKFDEILRLARNEEDGVADTELELVGELLRALRPDILGQRTGAAFLPFTPEDIAKARLALSLSPGIHAIAEGSIAAFRGRNCPYLG